MVHRFHVNATWGATLLLISFGDRAGNTCASALAMHVLVARCKNSGGK
jgi:hypothetical protein